jgi:hypothetical protein
MLSGLQPRFLCSSNNAGAGQVSLLTRAGVGQGQLRRSAQTHAAPPPPPLLQGTEVPPTATPPTAGERLRKVGETGGKVFRVVRGLVILAAVGYGVLAYSAYKIADTIPAGDVVLKVRSKQSTIDESIKKEKKNSHARVRVVSRDRGLSSTLSGPCLRAKLRSCSPC